MTSRTAGSRGIGSDLSNRLRPLGERVGRDRAGPRRKGDETGSGNRPGVVTKKTLRPGPLAQLKVVASRPSRGDRSGPPLCERLCRQAHRARLASLPGPALTVPAHAPSGKQHALYRKRHALAALRVAKTRCTTFVNWFKTPYLRFGRPVPSGGLRRVPGGLVRAAGGPSPGGASGAARCRAARLGGGGRSQIAKPFSVRYLFSSVLLPAELTVLVPRMRRGPLTGETSSARGHHG